MPRPPAHSLDEIASLAIPCIRPCDVAGALGVDRHMINILFRQGNPPFPGYMSGSHVHIYRIPFLRQVGYFDKGGDENH